MSNLHLVTGHAGKTHVTSADHGSFYAALFGSNNYILDKGSKFAASIISDNLVKIADGDLLMQGRHARIPDNEYVEVVIPNGTQGYKRRDLIVARYTKDADTGVEEMDLIVLIGDPIAAEPKDPAYITGDLIKDGALTNDLPLYRINLDGTTITGVDSLMPAVIPSMLEHLQEIENTVNDVKSLVTGNVAKIQTGSYTGTGKGTAESSALSLTFAFAPKLVFITRGDVYTAATTGQIGGIFNCVRLTSSYIANGYQRIASNGIYTTGKEFAKVSGNTLSWYSDAIANALASTNVPYCWVAIG